MAKEPENVDTGSMSIIHGYRGKCAGRPWRAEGKLVNLDLKEGHLNLGILGRHRKYAFNYT